jgi:EAL domain-containing protein (putative c-di-GMP-specific phosphodiesterase class I)/ActR/RegA family two-component response regulator
MRALVLDDDPAIGRLVRTIADPVGFVTELTTNALQFRSSYKTDLPDVVLLDLQIGETDGVEQLRFLSGEGYRNPLVLMSGFDDRVLATTEHLARSMGLRAVAALSKPLRAADLTRVLDQIKMTLEPVSEDQVLEAVRNGELLLEYQPIVSRDDRTKVCWLEALVRWDHPRHGRLTPDRFISIAERSVRVMDALTDWVVTAAARQHRALRGDGLIAPIAVNVSGKNLDDVGFVDRIFDRLQEADVPPGQFGVELTETAAAMDPAKTMDILARLRLKGIHLALDDFGTGYSSLKQLRQLPFSALKIDRSFITDLTTSRDSLVIVKSIIDLARNLELETVAEGVETEETATCLSTLGVTALQGYLIARPLPSAQLAGWLSARSYGG